MSCSLDTNVLLRLIVADVPELSERASTFLEHSSQKIHITDSVFVEIEYTLHKWYGFSRKQIAAIYTELFLHPQIVCNRDLFELVLPIYVDRPKLSFVDVMLAMYAKIDCAEPLYTFDKKLILQIDSVRELP